MGTETLNSRTDITYSVDVARFDEDTWNGVGKSKGETGGPLGDRLRVTVPVLVQVCPRQRTETDLLIVETQRVVPLEEILNRHS